jgi:hypothetical protein
MQTNTEYSFARSGNAAELMAAEFLGVLGYPKHIDKGRYLLECVLDLSNGICSSKRRREAIGFYRAHQYDYSRKTLTRIPSAQATDNAQRIQSLCPSRGSARSSPGQSKYPRAHSELADELNKRSPDERRRANRIQWTRERVVQEIWTPSKPVLHFALERDDFKLAHSLSSRSSLRIPAA